MQRTTLTCDHCGAALPANDHISTRHYRSVRPAMLGYRQTFEFCDTACLVAYYSVRQQPRPGCNVAVQP